MVLKLCTVIAVGGILVAVASSYSTAQGKGTSYKSGAPVRKPELQQTERELMDVMSEGRRNSAKRGKGLKARPSGKTGSAADFNSLRRKVEEGFNRD